MDLWGSAMEDDDVERQLLALEKHSASVEVRCRGVDAQGRRCTRTRYVRIEKFYRLPETKLFCHRHAPHATTNTTTRRPRRRSATHLRKVMVGVVGVALSAVALIAAGVHYHTLWVCLLGLVVFSLASVCACALVVVSIIRALWIGPNTATQSSGDATPRDSPVDVVVASIA